MEEKINMKFATFPMKLKAGSMKSLFFNLLE
jgi:hypothetical protein